jgi:hypothetical protein
MVCPGPVPFRRAAGQLRRRAVESSGRAYEWVLGRGEAGALNSSIRPREQRRCESGEVPLAYGFDRFLTTRTGSLPRPDDLIRAMFAKEEGVPVDRAALSARISEAVVGVVKKQVESGVDLVNDGEMSRPSYATYVKDRLTGFAGSSNTFVYQDLAEFPNLAKRVFSDPGRSRRRTPACTGPIGVADPAAPLADIDNLKAALTGVDA